MKAANENKISNKVQISVGDKFVNDSNGGQKVTVLSVNADGKEGVIRYRLHDSFIFNSLEYSSAEEELFLGTYRKID